jgi:uncharacterized membrane protein (UPF0182 family)
VLLGNNLTVPLDSSVLYIRPLYVSSSSDPMPQLRYVIAVFNQNVSIEPTLDAALSQVFDANITTGSTTTTPTKPGKGSTTPASVTQYLQAAANDYTLAQAALAKGNLGLYQADVEAMNHEIQLAQAALAAAK